jgi:transitional endoplasmic reticulum ATPase
MAKKEVQLKVVEALQDDVYKGVARIDSEMMRELDVRKGDVILIKGTRSTVAIVDRAYPADVGEGIIRIDGILRRNAKAGIGDMVSVSKADIREAKKVVIAPSQKGITVQADSESLRRGLLGRCAMKGDLIILGGVRRRKDLLSGEVNDMEDIFGNLNDIFNGMGFGTFGGITQLKFIIVSTNPNQPVIITENTAVSLNPKAVEIIDERVPEINYEDIGGLDDEIKKIREMVEIPLKHPEIFHRLGIDPPKGVLLHGPPGTGKTLLAKAVANESEANFILLNGPEIMSKFYGESEKKIRDIFEEAEKTAPAIVFIDEIDAIAPKREETIGEVERRVVSQLLTMMDGLKSRGKVIVIGATNRPNALDPALRRPGRFDREIEINVPDKEGRLLILKIHTRVMPLAKNVDLTGIASVTYGFVGADLEALCKEAAMNVLRKQLHKFKLDEESIPQEVLENLIVEQSDFLDALKVVRPSAMREVLVETPNVSWEEVGGLGNIKQDLKEAVEWPLKHPESFKRVGIRPARGILLYGPPGTGKTLLAKAVAKESEANFIQVKGPSLLSMWVGKSEEGMRKVFERARQVAPCIVFFDEIDALAGKRGIEAGTRVTERVLNQLLAEMDGLEDLNDVIVLGATNRPDMLDPALLRPGRFDKILLVNTPEEEGRYQILKIHTKHMPLTKNVNLKEIAKVTIGYTGADLEALTREAAMLALRESIDADQVGKKHFDEAVKKIKPSVTKQTVEIYKRIEENFLKSAKAAVPQESSYLG